MEGEGFEPSGASLHLLISSQVQSASLTTFLNLVPVPGLEPGCCTLVHRVSTYAGIIWWGKMELNHPSLLGNRFTVCPATSTVYSPEFGHHVRIRTLDTLLPKQVLYQTELRSVIRFAV